jgi:nitroreductase
MMKIISKLKNTEMKASIKRETVKDTETIQTIYERRAIRKYKDLPVSVSTVEKILDAGRMAPSAMNKQPWKFHILTQRETIHTFSNEIAKIAFRKVIKAGPKQILKTVAGLLHFSYGTGILKGGDPVFYGAPVIIFISAARDNEWAALDIGMCAENMMLAAKSLGLDSCPVGFAKFVEQTKIYTRLRIPSSEQVHLAVIIGYGDETPELHKRIRDNSFFIDFGG